MTEESEEDLETEVSRIEPKREENDDKKTLVIIGAVLCVGLLIAAIAATFWAMSSVDEPDDSQKDGGEGSTKVLYSTGKGSSGKATLTPPATVSNEAEKTGEPVPLHTAGPKKPSVKPTHHKNVTVRSRPTVTSTLASPKSTQSTTLTAVKKTTTSTTAYRTSSTAKPTKTTSPTTTPSTTSTTTVPPRLTLVCTVLEYPPGLGDNVCDYVFFDSLYREPNTEFQTVPYFHANFLEGAAKSNFTRFGFSIEVSQMQRFWQDFNSSGGEQIAGMCLSKRVYDWGVLSVHEKHIQDNPDALKEALTTLKQLKDLQTQKAKIEPYTVLGTYFPPSSCGQVLQYFKTIFLPRHVILLGQIAYGTNDPCVALPANNYVNPLHENKNLKWGHTVRDATKRVNCLQNEGLNISYSVSIEMESYQFEMNRGIAGLKPDERMYTECLPKGSFKRVSVPLLCGSGGVSWYYQDRFKTSYVIDNVGYLLNTYDTKQTLQMKVCDAWRDHGNSKIGISAYGINSDFPHAIFKCPKQQWDPNGSRLLFVQVFREFLRKESSGVNPKSTFFNRCMQLK